MTGTFKKIGLLHHMGGGNLGDDGTFTAVMQNIKERWPEAAIVGLTMNPEDTRRRHGIACYPIRQRAWGLGGEPKTHKPTLKAKVKAAARKSPAVLSLLAAVNFVLCRVPAAILKELLLLAGAMWLLQSLDLLVVCGGGQFVESSGGPWEFVGGPWGFPFTLLKWILAARFLGARCMVLNAGAGPLIRPLTKWFVRVALKLSHYSSFRDLESSALIQQIGFRGHTEVVCDSAYSLNTQSASGTFAAGEQSKGVVGFAPMAYGDPRLSAKHEPAVYDAFIGRLATFASWLLKEGYEVRLFCTDIGIDPPAIEDLERTLKRDANSCEAIGAGRLSRVHQWTTQELLDNMRSMDYVVACRFHAVVFAHLLNIPVLAINHHPKVRAQMSDLGLSEYCAEMENCELGSLKQTFTSLANNRGEVKRCMAEKLASYKSKLADQFDALFPPQADRDAQVRGRPVGQLGDRLAGFCSLFAADDSAASKQSVRRSASQFAKQLEQWPRGVLIIVSLLMVASVGWVDYVTGFETSYSVFYLSAIMFSGWYVGRGMAMVISILSVTVSFWADLAGGAHFSNAVVPVWNAGVLISIYFVVAWLVTSLRSLRHEIVGRPSAPSDSPGPRRVRMEGQMQFPLGHFQSLDSHKEAQKAAKSPGFLSRPWL